MLSADQLIIVGYRKQGDCPTCGQPGGDCDSFYGEYLCRGCGEEDSYATIAAVSRYEMGEETRDGSGIECEKCGKEIEAACCVECGRSEGRDGEDDWSLTWDDDDDCNYCTPGQGCKASEELDYVCEAGHRSRMVYESDVFLTCPVCGGDAWLV